MTAPIHPVGAESEANNAVMACGTPVVALRRGAVPEVVADG